MQKHITEIIKKIGEDPNRQGLEATPRRVAESYRFLTAGYQMKLKEIVNNAVFDENVQDMIIAKDIEFYSLCEHHMIPFFGKIHIGYVPEKKVIGLSKLARIGEMFSRRLQIQERLGHDIAEAIMEVLKPKGVGVVIEAQHLCMMMRGIQKQHSQTVTSTMLGLFREDSRTRSEFLQLIK